MREALRVIPMREALRARFTHLLSHFLLCAALLVPVSAVGAADSTKPAASHPPGTAIASAHALSTQAGIDIIRAGGNAFDAAIAVSSTLSVVEPISSGIGGGGFFLLHDAKTGRDVFVDARETAPAASTAAAYLDENGELNRDRATNGPWSAGIPGLPAALVHLAQRYGKLPLKTSLTPQSASRATASRSTRASRKATAAGVR